MRAVVLIATTLAFAALAFAVGRWLCDPSPGGPLVLLICAATVFVAAVRRLYARGGLGRKKEAAVATAPEPEPSPADDRIDLNLADAAELQTLPGIGAVGARRIVEEREERGPFATVGELVRVAGFGPGRVHSLAPRVKV
jgi:competence ComEA-like helix-hairpin-helix protein